MKKQAAKKREARSIKLKCRTCGRHQLVGVNSRAHKKKTCSRCLDAPAGVWPWMTADSVAARRAAKTCHRVRRGRRGEAEK